MYIGEISLERPEKKEKEGTVITNAQASTRVTQMSGKGILIPSIKTDEM